MPERRRKRARENQKHAMVCMHTLVYNSLKRRIQKADQLIVKLTFDGLPRREGSTVYAMKIRGLFDLQIGMRA